ncbi:unnamed protein product [Brugia timori]|uniref:Bm672 n=2 Tax=Brugia TaxID=6278 RepID=A0A1I9G4M4_BRUMA|nr:Bm672 [Brugia malayi]VDO29313.1 unnamed protein product [Brugia timori]
MLLIIINLKKLGTEITNLGRNKLVNKRKMKLMST